ncbi:putative ankyrin repeat protein RF_0381 [Phymastichus coffea]|uniref:putative ankyrin repeat protein RF_0381 n=1 Tax=Phymastichus coffea TaxID=108790 RepID=UPI00273ABE79|nr:putative ankyrin repeat protein RF_0381 [Phymastichus coffea]
MEANDVPIIPESVREFNVNQLSENGDTLLHVAVRMRDKEFVAVLLETGASVNIEDADGNTALSSAISIGSPEIVALLLQYNPDFSISIVRQKFYESLLNYSFDEEKIIRTMLKHGFKVNNTDNLTSSLLWASILLCLEDLAISFVNVKRALFIYVKNWYESFQLHWQPFTAKQTEMLRIITKIMSLYAEERGIKNSNNRNFDLFKLLLSEHDVDLMNVNVMSIGGNFDDNEESDIVMLSTDILLSCYDGESPVCDANGRTGLHYATKVGNIAVIQALLDLHLDINAIDNEGNTPLNCIYNRINEFSGAENNDETFNDEKHYDSEFSCFFTILDLKIGAIVLLKHVSKLISANSYITLGNLTVVKSLLAMLNSSSIVHQYYLSLYSYIEQCESEVRLMKSKKLLELSYFDFITKNCNQIAAYTRREDVIKTFQSNDNVLVEFEIFGAMLQHRFNISYLRRGLLDNAEVTLFDILKYRHLPIVVVREILGNLSNDELYFITSNT